MWVAEAQAGESPPLASQGLQWQETQARRQKSISNNQASGKPHWPQYCHCTKLGDRNLWCKKELSWQTAQSHGSHFFHEYVASASTEITQLSPILFHRCGELCCFTSQCWPGLTCWEQILCKILHCVNHKTIFYDCGIWFANIFFLVIILISTFLCSFSPSYTIFIYFGYWKMTSQKELDKFCWLGFLKHILSSFLPKLISKIHQKKHLGLAIVWILLLIDVLILIDIGLLEWSIFDRSFDCSYLLINFSISSKI